MNFRRSKNSQLPWRMALWFCVVLAIVLNVLNQTPLAVDVDFPAETPVELTRDAPADVVIVIDWGAIKASPNTFSGRDFSAAWINVFEQELGPVTIATPSTLNARLLDEARVIVLTASVAREIPDAITKRLREYALSGKLLIIAERPSGDLRERFAANGRVGVQRGRKFSWIRDLAEPTRTQLLEAEIDVEFIGSTMPKENSTTWLSVDGAPVVYSVPLGQGHIIIVDFDLGEFLVAAQQGRPREDFTLSSAHPTTVDLASFAPGTLLPVADTLERYLVHGVIGRLTPLPAFWPFPAGYDGVIVGLHTDHTLGNGGAWMLRYESSRKAASTLLTSVDSGFNPEGYELVSKLGGEVGLLWRMQGTKSALMESFGIGPVRPFARPRTLESQVDDFEKKIGAKPVTAQVFDHAWTSDWVTPLQAMSSQGIRLDLSYSPGSQAGYRFGSGFPFLIIDESGLPLSIREIPVVVPENPDVDGPNLQKILEASAATDHQLVTIDSTPSSFADFPDIAKFERWVDMFDQAEATHHQVTSAVMFDSFLRSRRASDIKTRTLRGTDTQPSATVLRVTVESKRGDMELMVPETVGEKRFSKARQKINRVGDELVSGELEATTSVYSGLKIRRVKLDSGFNTIDLYYEAP